MPRDGFDPGRLPDDLTGDRSGRGRRPDEEAGLFIEATG